MRDGLINFIVWLSIKVETEKKIEKEKDMIIFYKTWITKNTLQIWYWNRVSFFGQRIFLTITNIGFGSGHRLFKRFMRPLPHNM